MSKSTKVFIVEGESRDFRLINHLIETFFVGKYNATVIPLSANQNLYMLFQLMDKTDFEMDLIEVVRDNVEGADEKLKGIMRNNVDEIFLFFDFDLQQNNLSSSLNRSPLDILKEMVQFFDNETENGKLFLSYPMVEANYDFIINDCEAFSKCVIPIDNLSDYKSLAGKNNPVASCHFGYEEWKMCLESFNKRVLCLFRESCMNYEDYRKKVSTMSILAKQIEHVNQNNNVFVLGSYPQFLFEYFNESFWKAHFTFKNEKSKSCQSRKALNLQIAPQ